jgi:hypothetical protein
MPGIVTRTSHDGSHCTYQVDKSALHANVLCRIPISTALIIILLKPDIAWWTDGRPSDWQPWKKEDVSIGVRVVGQRIDTHCERENGPR